jgi:hypothetical protein
MQPEDWLYVLSRELKRQWVWLSRQTAKAYHIPRA